MKRSLAPLSFQLPAPTVLAATRATFAIVAISPLFDVSIPEGYRRWELVGPAHEADPPNELRDVLGDAPAMTAYHNGTLPFPDGAVLVNSAWRHVQSGESAPDFVPEEATTVRVLVKGSRRYAATGD